MVDPRLRQVGLFADLSDDDLEHICQGVEDRNLDAGETLFREGDPGDTAYVVAEGDLEVVKAAGRREVLLALRGPGSVVGEMALLEAEPRSATVRARTDAELLTIPKTVLDALLTTSPSAARAMFNTVLARLRETTSRQRHSERMVQLGTLTAGITHELNNPAAAAQRGADRLLTALRELGDAVVAGSELPSDAVARVVAHAATAKKPALDTVARSDAEEALEDWLDDLGVDQPWTIAGELVEAGVTPAELEEVTAGLDGAAMSTAIGLLKALLVVQHVASEIGEASRRVSGIVGRLKSYAFLDRAPVQPVDVHSGLDDTLTLLAPTLADIRIVRDYDKSLPPIMAAGADLNQVWTNLIDNAAYALSDAGTNDPAITVTTRREGDDAVVTVSDNGPGVPEDVRNRVFDPFFTTKPPGAGTGQGLNLAYQIIVLDHGGEIGVESQPGSTTFRVALPLSPTHVERGSGATT